MEETVFQKLAESGATMALLGFVVWAVVALVRTLAESHIRLGEQLAKSNSDLATALRELDKSRAESQQVHQEQILLLKMALDKLSEQRHD
jgi:hypothetical protein